MQSANYCLWLIGITLGFKQQMMKIIQLGYFLSVEGETE